MLNVLTSNHLTDVVAVVTRYFGGIKLGAGGLVRAYSEAVAQAVAAAGTRRVELCSLLGIDADFASIGAVEDSLRGLILPSGAAVAVVGVDWGDRARITVAVPVTATGEFDAFLAALSAGTLTAVPAADPFPARCVSPRPGAPAPARAQTLHPRSTRTGRSG